MTVVKSTKYFANLIYFDPLTEDSPIVTRPMFGCLAIYYQGLNVALLANETGTKTYRETIYPFDLWDGVLLPTSREHHRSLQTDFNDLVVHPVLGKWLYLPQQTEGFEDILETLVRLIRRNDPRFGIVPQAKAKKNQQRRTRPSNTNLQPKPKTTAKSSPNKARLKRKTKRPI